MPRISGYRNNVGVLVCDGIAVVRAGKVVLYLVRGCEGKRAINIPNKPVVDAGWGREIVTAVVTKRVGRVVPPVHGDVADAAIGATAKAHKVDVIAESPFLS